MHIGMLVSMLKLAMDVPIYQKQPINNRIQAADVTGHFNELSQVGKATKHRELQRAKIRKKAKKFLDECQPILTSIQTWTKEELESATWVLMDENEVVFAL